jgi:uncharacterized protein (TIGR02266 family)
MRQGEQRSFPRVPVALTAHCRIGTHFSRDPVADLSEGGLYLRTRDVSAEGTPVRVALALPTTDGVRVCTLVGRVARVDRDVRGGARGLGVRLTAQDITAADREALRGFVVARAAMR